MEDNLFKNKNFMLLIIGQVISLVGSRMNSFAFALYVLALTGSGSKFASILIVGLIPQLILTPVCGVFADWLDRKKIMVYLDLLMGVIFGILCSIAVTSEIKLLHIYITVVMASVCQSLYNPAVGAAIPSLVNKEKLIKANSIESTVMTLGGVVAPIIAGAVYGLMGIKIILLLNAISFILAAIMESFIELKSEIKKISGDVYKEFIQDFKDGIKFVISNKSLKYIIILCFFINGILAGSMSVGIPFLCKIVFKITDLQFGLTETLSVAGTLVGAIFAPKVAKKVSLEKLFSLVILGCGILLVLLSAVISSPAVSAIDSIFITWIITVIILICFSIICALINIAIGTLMQKATPNNMLGRVMSVIVTISMVAMPLGQVIYGALFDNISSFYIFGVSALMILLISMISFKVLKSPEEQPVVVVEV